MNENPTEVSGLINIIKDSLELPKDYNIELNAMPHDIPGWDSIGWLSVISKIEEEWHVVFPLEQLNEIRKIEDLVRLSLGLKHGH